jgi:4-alpha-glucanotransferase
MLLPVGAVAAGETSPYSGLSVMALDPIYIAMPRIPELTRRGAEAVLSSDTRERLNVAREAKTVRYADVRAAKREAMRLAFDEFVRNEWEARSPRAAALETFIAREAWWLDDYALFRSLTEAHANQSWWTWDEGVRERRPAALAAARRDHAGRVLRHQYVQWIADGQWRAAHAAARRAGLAILGDLPFTVSAHSADVWARQDIFHLDISTGAPPDAFSDTGQDWSLPFFDWDTLAASDYDWLRQRARRMASLFDGLRIDHLVGLYRTYGWTRDGRSFFSPAGQDAQVRQGEAVLGIYIASGLHLVAEDLGAVPAFVRESMARLHVPGSKVLRWERRWDEPGQPFVDPADYPPESAAMPGTHDTEPLAAWWEGLAPADRAALVDLPALRRHGVAPGDDWSDALRDALLESLYASGADQLLLPLPDVFGWRDRINTPSTTGDHNWTWRLPWPVDVLRTHPVGAARASSCHRLADRFDRLSGAPPGTSGPAPA